jgi:hypothetical protein
MRDMVADFVTASVARNRRATHLAHSRRHGVIGWLLLLTCLWPTSTHAQIAACTAEDNHIWELAADTAGILIADGARSIGGATVATRYASGSFVGAVLDAALEGYVPASGYRELACGRLAGSARRKSGWTVYRGLGTELDLHQYLVLADRFKFLARDVPRGRAECPECIWGEVTVPPDFEWFWKQDAPFWASAGRELERFKDQPCLPDSSTCRGKTRDFPVGARACMYGPWILEPAHHYRPEIHPVEVFWAEAAKYVGLFFVTDASGRFNRNYSDTFLSPQPFKKWTEPRALDAYFVARVDQGGDNHLSVTSPRSKTEQRSIGDAPFLLRVEESFDTPLRMVRQCQAGNRRQMLVKMTVPGGRPSRAFSVHSHGLGLAHGQPPVGPRNGAAGGEAARLDAVTSVDWGAISDRTFTASDALRKAWGVGERTAWRAVARHDVMVAVSRVGEEEQEEGALSHPIDLVTSAEWNIAVDRLDQGPEPLISLEHPRRVNVTVSGANVRLIPRDVKGFKLVVDFLPVRQNDRIQAIAERRISVGVTLMTPPQQLQTAPIELYSKAPDFISELSGYNWRANRGAYPEPLLRVLHGWFASKGCRASFAEFVAALGVPQRTEEPRADWSQLPTQRALGLLRQTTVLMTDDHSVEAAEFGGLVKAATRVTQHCSGL